MRRWSAHLSTLLPGIADPMERPAAAAALGFATVESWWPVAPDPGAWAEAVRAAGMRAALVNADGGDLAAGERGYCNLPQRAEDVLAAVAASARAVVAAGGGVVNLLVGRDDRRRSVDEQLAVAARTIGRAAEVAAALGARVVIEHLNAVDVDRPLVSTPAEAAALVRRIDHPAVGLLFDAYHAAMAGLDPVAELSPVIDLVAHVQYADSPGRGAPGTGTVNLAAFVAELDRLGYDGVVGLEFTPAAATPAEWVRSLPGGHAAADGEEPARG